MPIPEKFPIKRIEGYHTHHLGRFADGNQFFGSITQTFQQPENYTGDWQNHVQQHLILYIFDKKGNHIDTKYQYAEVTLKINRKEQMITIENMVKEIGSFQYCDIIVKPFQVDLEISGSKLTFGLVPLYEENVIVLEPGNSIAIREPWDGSYDT